MLEAETGSGKTEAALWHFARLLAAGLVDSLYFALPTRVAASEIHGRVTSAADALFGMGVVKPVLAIPGYIRAGAVDGQRLPPFAVLWPDRDEPTPSSDGRWAAERPKRFLGVPVAVGTIDQAFLSALQTGHAHLRAAALSRSLLVVDEVHASDIYMTSVLRQVLANHLAVGGRALLMSATLGAAARASLTGAALPDLTEAVATPYPAVTRDRETRPIADAPRRKAVAVDPRPIIALPEAVASRAAAAARDGATVVVIRNTVRDALATQAAIEALADPAHLFRAAGLVTMHHGRFAAEDRRLLDAEVTRIFGKGRTTARRIVVGNQTFEQSSIWMRISSSRTFARWTCCCNASAGCIGTSGRARPATRRHGSSCSAGRAVLDRIPRPPAPRARSRPGRNRGLPRRASGRGDVAAPGAARAPGDPR